MNQDSAQPVDFWLDGSQPLPEAIPERLAHKKSGVNLKFMLGGALLIALVVGLMVTSTFSSGTYFYTVDELLARAPTVQGERVRIDGAIVAGSEDWDAANVTLRFSLSGEQGGELPVLFEGPRPDSFQRAVSAIVEGHYNEDGIFIADQVMPRCPSRYEEEPVATSS